MSAAIHEPTHRLVMRPVWSVISASELPGSQPRCTSAEQPLSATATTPSRPASNSGWSPLATGGVRVQRGDLSLASRRAPLRCRRAPSGTFVLDLCSLARRPDPFVLTTPVDDTVSAPSHSRLLHRTRPSRRRPIPVVPRLVTALGVTVPREQPVRPRPRRQLGGRPCDARHCPAGRPRRRRPRARCCPRRAPRSSRRSTRAGRTPGGCTPRAVGRGCCSTVRGRRSPRRSAPGRRRSTSPRRTPPRCTAPSGRSPAGRRRTGLAGRRRRRRARGRAERRGLRRGPRDRRRSTATGRVDADGVRRPRSRVPAWRSPRCSTRTARWAPCSPSTPCTTPRGRRASRCWSTPARASATSTSATPGTCSRRTRATGAARAGSACSCTRSGVRRSPDWPEDEDRWFPGGVSVPAALAAAVALQVAVSTRAPDDAARRRSSTACARGSRPRSRTSTSSATRWTGSPTS